jgi:RNA polymerase sigma factor (TIGR02999 family)
MGENCLSPDDPGTDSTVRAARRPSADRAAMAEDVTRILSAINGGDGRAAEQLLPLVYDELRKLAAAKMSQEEPGQTLQATALVHEAYLRLVGDGQDHHWNSRGHFYSAAAEAMRRILVESVRRKRALKHGGGHQRVELSETGLMTSRDPGEFLMLNDAVDQLWEEDPEAGEITKLRLFAGLSVDQAAELLGLPHTTAYRHWTYARAWLQTQLNERR